MKEEEILKRVEKAIKEINYGVANYNWWKTVRVLRNSRRMNQEEKADDFMVQMIALFSDIFEWKKDSYLTLKESIRQILSDTMTYPYLSKAQLYQLETSEEILKNQIEVEEMSKECQIVKDALLLDDLGAIGIAKNFIIGYMAGKPIYMPDAGFVDLSLREKYVEFDRDSVSRFYLQLFTYPDKMHTKQGKKIAQKRVHYMEEYLKELYNEWNGID